MGYDHVWLCMYTLPRQSIASTLSHDIYKNIAVKESVFVYRKLLNNLGVFN